MRGSALLSQKVSGNAIVAQWVPSKLVSRAFVRSSGVPTLLQLAQTIAKPALFASGPGKTILEDNDCICYQDAPLQQVYLALPRSAISPLLNYFPSYSPLSEPLPLHHLPLEPLPTEYSPLDCLPLGCFLPDCLLSKCLPLGRLCCINAIQAFKRKSALLNWLTTYLPYHASY